MKTTEECEHKCFIPYKVGLAAILRSVECSQSYEVSYTSEEEQTIVIVALFSHD